ncbi:hypothetical protein GCM10027296_35430 [Chitinimonas naiadis]
METGMRRREVLEFVDGLSREWGSKSRSLSVRLLRALIRLSLAEPEKEGFTSIEVAEEMDREKKTTWLAGGVDPDKLRGNVREQFKALQLTFDEKSAGIAQRLAHDNFGYTIRLHKVESRGGSGNQSLYGLALVEIGPEDQVPVWDPSETEVASLPVVTYTTDDVVTKDRLTKLLARGIQMRGIYRFVFLTVCLVLLVAVAILGTVLVIQLAWPGLQADTRSLLLQVAIAITVAMTLHDIFSLPTKRVAMAPFWLQGENWDCVLQWSRHVGQPATIQVVRYGATCPVCGGEVRIRSGEFRFYGRLVGTCVESPREHIYSFDHIMRRGRLLVR